MTTDNLSHIAGRHVLLIVTAGIAAYKSLELIRLIQKQGGSVQVVLTPSATRFVTELSVATLSGRPAFTQLFDLTRETEIGHIELSRSADLIVVAPATADFLAKMAHGMADDLASTTCLATDTDILVAPAMNVRMWNAPATLRNLALLRTDGVRVVGPEEGEMACGEFGPGRMAEPVDIAQAIGSYFAAGQGPLQGRHIVMTSGPTREPIDPVRFISNASSGKQGRAIAEALIGLGADVTFITGPAEAGAPVGARVVPVTTAAQMHAAVTAALPADAAIFAAAVADWRVETPGAQKLKKSTGAPPTLAFAANPDILAEVAHLPQGQRPDLVIGFAAETENLLENARAKRVKKGCDWLLANDVGAESGVFGADSNRVVRIDGHGEKDWGEMSKADIGHRLAQEISEHLSKKDRQ